MRSQAVSTTGRAFRPRTQRESCEMSLLSMDRRVVGNKRTSLVLSLGMATVVVSMMQTLTVPILPIIQRDLHAAPAAVGWVTTVTLLAAAVCTPLLTRLGDQRGKRRVLIGVLVAAVVGSVVATVTSSLPLLLVSRALQGSSTAIFPLALSILRDELPPTRLPTAMAAVSSTLAVGSGLALAAAGVLTQGENPDYHRVFLFSAVLCTLALVAVTLVVPPSSQVAGGRIDWIGAAVLACVLVLILLPLSQANTWGWGSVPTLASFGAAIVAGGFWVVFEKHRRDALVDMKMLTLRPVVLTNLAGILLGFGMFTQYIGISTFVQAPAHLAGYGFTASTVRASVEFLLPGAVASLVTGQVAGIFIRRFGARIPLAVGACSGVLGFTGLAFLHDTPASVIAAGLLTGIAVSCGFATLPIFIAAGVPALQNGIANGVNSIARSTGSSVASAVVITLLTSGTLPDLPGESATLATESQYVTIFLLGAGAFACVAVIAMFGLPTGASRPGGPGRPRRPRRSARSRDR
ncbi:MFS transporter [Streptomyces sp. NPDC057137]|uniref:MFS transporter n=1 Tax=Streptomyces sp. NPDC057137 TaxID=3346030 RepID=UPI00363D0A3E